MTNKVYYQIIISGGYYEDSFRFIPFITDDEDYAKAYVEKFNRLIPKAKERYRKLEDDFNIWLKDEYEDEYGERYNYVRNLAPCMYTKIEFRSK